MAAAWPSAYDAVAPVLSRARSPLVEHAGRRSPLATADHGGRTSPSPGEEGSSGAWGSEENFCVGMPSEMVIGQAISIATTVSPPTTAWWAQHRPPSVGRWASATSRDNTNLLRRRESPPPPQSPPPPARPKPQIWQQIQAAVRDRHRSLRSAGPEPAATSVQLADMPAMTDNDSIVSYEVTVSASPASVRGVIQRALSTLSSAASERTQSWAPRRNRRSTLASRVSKFSYEVCQLVTFTGCQGMLRATPLNTILRGGANLFSDSHGSEETYFLSAPVEQIEWFISHNWAVSRFNKFIALAFHFNFDIAAIFTVVLAMLAGVASAVGWMPHVHDEVYGRSGFVVRLCGVPVFLFVLFFSRDVLGRMGQLGPNCFLDKTCIHQVDRFVQQQGIRKLGAFIGNSEHLLILYTDMYLTKLWTVYEVASFLVIHDVESIRAVPIEQARCFCCIMLATYVFVLAVMIIRSLTTVYQAAYLVVLPAMALYCSLIRKWKREEAMLKERIRSFAVEDSLCHCEADRPLVYNNIARLMQAFGAAAKDCEQKDALATFNAMVHDSLPDAFMSAMGLCAFRYKHYLAFGSSVAGAAMLDYRVLFAYEAPLGMPVRETCCHMLTDMLWLATVWPLLFVGIEIGASCFLHFHGWRQLVWVATCTLLLTVVCAVLFASTLYARKLSFTSNAALVFLCVANVLGPYLAYFVCQGVLRRQTQRRPRASWARARSLSSDSTASEPARAGTEDEGDQMFDRITMYDHITEETASQALASHALASRGVTFL